MSKKVSKKVALAKSVVKNLNRKIARENAAFEALSAPEKRVAIARDVLAQLRSKRLVATEGMWLTTDTENGTFISSDDVLDLKDKEVKTVLKDVKRCYGCALGGMFMCAVEKANKLKVKDLEDFYDPYEKEPYDPYSGDSPSDIDNVGNDAFKYLQRFFKPDQLKLIESAFERGDGAHVGASDFAYKVDDPSERMRLIMENIIVNKGVFKPKMEPQITWTTPGFVF